MNDANIPITVPFEPAHAACFRLRPMDVIDYGNGACPDMAATLALYAAHPGWTCFAGEQVLWSYGAVRVEGTASIWSMSDVAATDHALRASRCMRNFVAWLLCPQGGGCHRVQAFVLRQNDTSRRWLQRLGGLRVEGLMRACGPDQRDRWLMGRVVASTYSKDDKEDAA